MLEKLYNIPRKAQKTGATDTTLILKNAWVKYPIILHKIGIIRIFLFLFINAFLILRIKIGNI